DRAWEENEIDRLRELLEAERRDQSGGLDLRRFEWFYWRRKCLPEISKLQVHPFGVNDIAFSADGKLLAAAGGDHIIRIWDSTTNKEVFSFSLEKDCISMAFHPSGKLLAFAGSDGSVQTLDLVNRRLSATVQEGKHVEGLFRVAFSPDGKRLAYTGWDGAKLWNIETG